MLNTNPRPGHRRPVLAAALAAASLCALAPTLAQAHFTLVSPTCLTDQDVLGNPQKAAPCGGAGTATNKVTTYKAGDTVTIAINETVFHPGHYRVLLAKDQASLPADPVVKVGSTPCGSTDINPNPQPPLLGDGLLLHTKALSGQQTMQVKLPPNMTCNNCVLQVVQFMSNHALNNPGGCFYHHCATINVEAAAVSDGGGVSDGGVTDASTAPDLSDSPDLSVVTEPPAPTGCAMTQRAATPGAPALALLFFGLGLTLRRRRSA